MQRQEKPEYNVRKKKKRKRKKLFGLFSLKYDSDRSNELAIVLSLIGLAVGIYTVSALLYKISSKKLPSPSEIPLDDSVCCEPFDTENRMMKSVNYDALPDTCLGLLDDVPLLIKDESPRYAKITTKR
ncbi:unnamed protein product [Enterobius vermicularis]|uniref:Polyprotein n=1 Tax=Enterobius vermicularis TaxID=51028 RepID=A0A0N4V3T9_ENTVE|nr:unnamed protein product [Enterobius vermicularis]